MIIEASEPSATTVRQEDFCLDRNCRRYVTTGWRKVEGWLSELAVLEIVSLAGMQRKLGICGPICEIGVHHGRTFILLHLLTQPGELSAAFDLYELQNERNGQERKRRLLENLRKHHGDLDRVRVVTADSLRLTPQRIVESCAGRPRIFSIDGGRCAKTTYNDLALARRTLCDGGLVSVTDYFSEGWPEVSEGVCRFMRDNGDLHPVVIGGNKFFLTTSKELGHVYRDALASAFGVQARWSVVFNEPVLLLTPLTYRHRIVRTRLWQTIRDTSVGRGLRTLAYRVTMRLKR